MIIREARSKCARPPWRRGRALKPGHDRSLRCGLEGDSVTSNYCAGAAARNHGTTPSTFVEVGDHRLLHGDMLRPMLSARAFPASTKGAGDVAARCSLRGRCEVAKEMRRC